VERSTSPSWLPEPSGRTPYNDQYATCERAVANLLIYGRELDPHEVSRRLGLEPSDAARTGQVRTNSRGRERTTPIGHWFLSSEEHVVSRDLRRHLDWLLDLLAPRAATLRELQSRPGWAIRLDCIWWSKFGDGGPTLWPQHMRAIADLDLELGFEIGFYGDEDEPGDATGDIPAR
jgi:Domain of unknown function (DUF4279)